MGRGSQRWAGQSCWPSQCLHAVLLLPGGAVQDICAHLRLGHCHCLKSRRPSTCPTIRRGHTAEEYKGLSYPSSCLVSCSGEAGRWDRECLWSGQELQLQPKREGVFCMCSEAHPYKFLNPGQSSWCPSTLLHHCPTPWAKKRGSSKSPPGPLTFLPMGSQGHILHALVQLGIAKTPFILCKYTVCSHQPTWQYTFSPFIEQLTSISS